MPVEVHVASDKLHVGYKLKRERELSSVLFSASSRAAMCMFSVTGSFDVSRNLSPDLIARKEGRPLPNSSLALPLRGLKSLGSPCSL